MSGINLGLDDIEKKLDDYGEKISKEKEKTARINKILFLILVVVVIIFLLASWRYYSIH
jgi:cell division protein FtsB